VNGEKMDDLIEATVAASREQDEHGRIVPPPAWWDLPPEALDEVYERQLLSRRLERLLDAEGHSTTVKTVLRRLRS